MRLQPQGRMAKPEEEQELRIWTVQTEGNFSYETDKISFGPETVKPSKFQPTPPNPQ